MAALPEAPAGFFDELQALGFSPGWAKREPAMWATPRPVYVPAVWRYQDALDALTRATSFVSTEFAERRNLIMVNPIPGNSYPTCRHLVAAYQLVLPGETARSHRHSPNALRLVLDASPGIYTLVNGMRIDMAPGDVVLTPRWCWHGHANYGDQPALWIDFLDVPLVQNLECMFFEHHRDPLEAVRQQQPDSPLRQRGSAIARRLATETDIRLGESDIPTMGLHMIKVQAEEMQHHPGRADNNIFAVTGGSLAVRVEKQGEVTLTRGDVMVVPGWHEYTITGGTQGATALRVTDEPVFAMLGFLN
jgi:gentisate 1,2-dioxygenase